MLEKLKWNGSTKIQDLVELAPKKKKKNVLFIIGDWKSKIGRHQIPGVTGMFGLGNTK